MTPIDRIIAFFDLLFELLVLVTIVAFMKRTFCLIGMHRWRYLVAGTVIFRKCEECKRRQWWMNISEQWSTPMEKGE